MENFIFCAIPNLRLASSGRAAKHKIHRSDIELFHEYWKIKEMNKDINTA